MNIAHIEQDNVHDGSILVVDPHYDATFITLLDRSNKPMILALTTDELKAYHDAYLERLLIDSGEAFIEPDPTEDDE